MCLVNVYPHQAKLLMSSYPLIDIRTEEEYIDHHVPGSILIPMPFFKLIFPKLVKNRSCIIICEHGNRSSLLAMNNLEMFKKVFNVIGGISLWMKEGYEVTKGLDRNGEMWKEYLKLSIDEERNFKLVSSYSVMGWDFKVNKINNVKRGNISCSIDEIVESKELQKIREKYNLSQGLLHKFVTDFVIKIYVEKKMREEDVLSRFSEIPQEAKLELAREIKEQAKSKGIS